MKYLIFILGLLIGFNSALYYKTYIEDRSKHNKHCPNYFIFERMGKLNDKERFYYEVGQKNLQGYGVHPNYEPQNHPVCFVIERVPYPRAWKKKGSGYGLWIYPEWLKVPPTKNRRYK